jgi:hypothetical protein
MSLNKISLNKKPLNFPSFKSSKKMVSMNDLCNDKNELNFRQTYYSFLPFKKYKLDSNSFKINKNNFKILSKKPRNSSF